MKRLFSVFIAVVFLLPLTLYCEESKPSDENVAELPSIEEKAQDSKVQEKYPNIKLGGQSFFDYTYTRSAGESFNAFHVTRAFLRVYGDVAKNWGYRITLDVVPLAGWINESITLGDGTQADVLINNGANARFVEAFMSYNLFGHNIYFGLISTAWENYVLYNVWFHRRVALSPLGGNGYATNLLWDLGIAVNGKLFDKILEYHIGIYNGEGFQNIREVSNHKNFQGRFTFTPFGDLVALSTGIEFEMPDTGAGRQYVVPTVMLFNIKDMIKPALFFNYMRISGFDYMALSLILNAYIMDSKINPFLRWDYGIKAENTASSLAKNDHNLFAGVGYRFNKHVTVDLAFIYGREANGPDTYAFGPFAEITY